ncbi:HAMP domain-containing histidine kinase [Erythrobacteraceae bacterium CFH 75059]|uniref:sensor histidine kinase n=1 Tax=Qipengyuania thermophila TaxID=2509361 RepID=UPI0010207CFA|nr:HAMP domain-containing sensor histidine kinase [Qipengyuania thermophila]TCD05281.1 HAMP domain-containing histidine kinase [Erythrobacteraceae bacterium CFH 75059]
MTTAATRRVPLAEGLRDRGGLLLSADPLIASLQRDHGGVIPGAIAVPDLAALADQAVDLGVRLSRTVRAYAGDRCIKLWAECEPLADGNGCKIRVYSVSHGARHFDETAHADAVRRRVDMTLAEVSARLDPQQNLCAVTARGRDTRAVAAAMRGGIGQPWFRFVRLVHGQDPLLTPWQVLDGAECEIPGSERRWTIRLDEITIAGVAKGFDLHLVPQTALVDESDTEDGFDREAIGSLLVPALATPVDRIAANAALTARRLRGPLPDTYSQYAANIVEAVQHLRSMLAALDLPDEVDSGELPQGATVDLFAVCQSAAQMLAGEADRRGIRLAVAASSPSLVAQGDERRVRQIVLNLLANAIKYGPARSTVQISVARAAGVAKVSVTDEGAELAASAKERLFRPGERLGRQDQPGSGLGLFASRRQAEEMGGRLAIDETGGNGTRFTLTLPLPHAG